MAGRIPLGLSNADNRPKSGFGKKARSVIPPTMDRASLVESLRAVNSLSCPSTQTRITEEDILKPSADRVQLIYLMLLNVVFGAAPSTFSQVPFQGIPTDYPELYEEHHFRVNFLRSLQRLMNVCLLTDNDFSPRDILEPSPKRLQKHLSAVVNYVKFFNFAEQISNTEGKRKEIEELNEKLKASVTSITDIQREIAELEESKEARKEVEDARKHQIAEQEHELRDLKTHMSNLESRLKLAEESQERSKKAHSTAEEDLKRSDDRINDLKMQVVTSPQELYQSVDEVRKDLEDKRNVRDETIGNATMWETLAKKASDVTPSVDDTIGEIDELSHLVEKTIQLDNDLKRLMDSKRKLTQELKSKISRDQNLSGQVKKIDEEINGLSQYKRTLSSTDGDSEQQKEIESFELILENKKEKDKEMLMELEETKQKHSKRIKAFEKLETQVTNEITLMKETYHTYQRRLEKVNKPLNSIKKSL
ncbi:PREDICTED: kinetochore protein Nuf2-like [Amphimedon queenslandica]|uniref:Kinetochore protein Nuf2 N-terminal domain-containing protein n=1 Tax=Amphimedon queenslandica TaxID=400682 RepID=A0A1X7UNI7_AMPQE|nr:PREDICTED: kinetochore protein Nuf2-like [Amphimedon queenslandica]|eukprot:XP_019853297.1 PREDICTED: kinetochore protein Nuf2-like [Amphimedon queenslandica]